MVALTIGMAAYKDFDGVYFTIQALRMYQDLTDTELLVVDNFGDDDMKGFVEGWAKGRYILAKDAVGTAAPRNRVFQEAGGEAVLCIDSHILIVPGAIERLRQYYRDHPDTNDLLQGPLVYDDLKGISTHFAPEWRGQMWGTWATDPRGENPEGDPFDIPMQGLGLFSSRRDAWLGFNPHFRGFGGEEGYIHEKVRQAGGRCLCLPWLRWMHRFSRPGGVPYPLYIEDKLRNYIIGHSELGLDLAPIIAHFEESLPPATVAAVTAEALSFTAERGITAAFTPVHPVGVAASDRPPEPQVHPGPLPRQAVSPRIEDGEYRRAIVCFVEDTPHLIQQVLALRESWLYSFTADTDLVTMGPAEVLARLPDDIVKIPQRPAADDPVWHGYRYVNAIACLNGAGAEQLDRYTHLLRTDADTFITPAWNAFRPATFTFGSGAYSNDDDIRQRIRGIAEQYGLVHRGNINVGTSWYGPTQTVRRAAAFAEMLTKQLLTNEFAADPGAWPGWYREVSVRYAGEIAVNHCAPDAQPTDQLDAWSTSAEPIARYAHVHCWHTDDRFSKHWFMSGRYTEADAQNLDLGIVRDYAMAMSFRSLVPSAASDRDELVSIPAEQFTPSSEEPAAKPSEASVQDPSSGSANGGSDVLPGRSSHNVRPVANLPLVSCLCATYNRPPSHQHLIEEAIESFLRQDYPNKELIIVNDTAGQELDCDAPGVRIVNLDDRYPTLGEKYNAAVDMAEGELLAPWDDDDISLPWRLSLSVERLGDKAYFNPRSYWFLDPNGFHFDHNVGYAHNASLVTRSAFEAVGRYVPISVGYDASIDAALSAQFKPEESADPLRGSKALTRAEWVYIYRWGVSPGHVSGGGTEEKYREIGERPIVEGRFYLTPLWRMDYVAETRRLLDAQDPDAA